MIWLALCLAIQDPALTVQPASAAIGQPLQVEFVYAHSSADGLADSTPTLDLDDSWVVLDGPQVKVVPSDGGKRTSVHWSVLSLEPGERVLPGLNLVLADGSNLAVGGARLNIAGELGADEDSPRPLPPFQDVQERTGALRPAHLGALGLALIALWVWRVWRRRRRQRQVGREEPGEWARFSALKLGYTESGSDLGAKAKDVSSQLAFLLRSAAQHQLTTLQAGQADEEWLDHMRAEGQDALADEFAPLLETCERIRFGGLIPTRFALDELLQASESVLARLAPDAPDPKGAAA